MSAAILSDARLPVILRAFDVDLAESARAQPCSCGGAWHAAHFRRKPRGLLDMPLAFLLRFSFCCSRCRKRHTPPSVRFLGPHVYAFPVVVLVCAMTSGLSGSRLATLRAELGVDRRTLERWRSWWREVFFESAFWKAARARCAQPITDASALWAAFGTDLDALARLLQFIAPISTYRQAS